ncbi:glycosyltransferase family 2 protein [Flavobacterium gawalongense]|uniref:Glycosyltransferase family 2 protein n=1 Tax=Flavobacterium gawalongense TaxID=2594432 RepID=A0A553BYV4_9FLAO|nr:glycosyltransferase family 2 protein [Flavobacterium gawalongense]TRX13405.1 glycosyltransferase family 2 protein [Flavobacterium gawalongense]TRX15665.1 glycosyltransferase family 2 protein [Flavobacterium gawalongense]TRX31503.1 glycosyltransferase family 2 protein [Flavobacterium gawalongense]
METEKIKLSIIVPCYNEEKNIPLILEKFNEVIKTDDIEVVLVDNGSTDKSEKVFNRLVPNYFFAKVVKVEVNQGYGFGISSGLKEARGEFIGYTHADMQTDPTDVVKAFEIVVKQINPKNCYVKGDRKGRTFFDQFFTIGMSTFETMYLRTPLWDINAQPNIFHRSFFESLNNIPKDFSLDLYLLYMAKKRGLELVRFEVVFPPRIHGQSSWNKGFASKWKFIKRTIDFSTKLKKEL